MPYWRLTFTSACPTKANPHKMASLNASCAPLKTSMLTTPITLNFQMPCAKSLIGLRLSTIPSVFIQHWATLRPLNLRWLLLAVGLLQPDRFSVQDFPRITTCDAGEI